MCACKMHVSIHVSMYDCMYVCMSRTVWKHLSPINCCVCFQDVYGQESSYELILTFHQYDNPTGGRVNRTDCCDWFGICFAPCETHFVICLRSDHFSHADSSCPWPMQKVETDIIVGNSITFNQTIGMDENPIMFTNDFFPEVQKYLLLKLSQ